ncbi:MAG TPA: hypothetical protein VMD53_18745, partial [Rhizomicrobium sp.]|nr:hypothetical protein [Rhizomicrobium sp.]
MAKRARQADAVEVMEEMARVGRDRKRSLAARIPYFGPEMITREMLLYAMDVLRGFMDVDASDDELERAATRVLYETLFEPRPLELERGSERLSHELGYRSPSL